MRQNYQQEVTVAKRPVFISKPEGNLLVETRMVDFTWFPGMAVSQKQKSIASLHQAAVTALEVKAILEISTKSMSPLGVSLSAFNLMYQPEESDKRYSLEALFQSSKVFSQGGPFRDMREMTPRDAKQDSRLKSSGNLLCFNSGGRNWPLTPKTAFYDWLYLNVLTEQPELAEQLMDYEAFTDIEFNPEKSINCQAYSAALYVALQQRGLLKEALGSQEAFLQQVRGFEAGETGSDTGVNRSLF